MVQVKRREYLIAAGALFAAPFVHAQGGATPTPPKPAAVENETLFQQAQALEASGKAAEAIRIYRQAARSGSGDAAIRLGEIYDKGVPGVSRDYSESRMWYQRARELGTSRPLIGDFPPKIRGY